MAAAKVAAEVVIALATQLVPGWLVVSATILKLVPLVKVVNAEPPHVAARVNVVVNGVDAT